MEEHRTRSGHEGRDEQGVYEEIPVGREKLLAAGVERAVGNLAPRPVELTAQRVVAAPEIVMYFIRSYPVNAPLGYRPEPVAFDCQYKPIRDCWREVVGGELSDSTLKGGLR